MEGLGVREYEIGGQAVHAKERFPGRCGPAGLHEHEQPRYQCLPMLQHAKACGQPIMPASATAPTCPPATAGCQLHAPHAAASLEVGPHPGLAHHGALHTRKASYEK